ncbi:tRNA(Glu)-specific nuclease WapA precursor [Ruminiclostridium hungatei]|uniref:tRNA(Glu)-specific nuclease WapA n=1 Tax=Ruminiclostridium hungatei TaxID=48256 RepID=A0A1V4SL61_RUMHU|nr:tRNA(Glu)-specific nuclease WapA precursor [Ruminiclostridium hungatei]
MVKVTEGSSKYSYTYNWDGLRASKTVNGVTTNHIWDGDQMVLETDGAGNATEKYIRGINLIYFGEGANRRYFLYNGHGDTVQLTSTTGSSIKVYDYDAFGNEKAPDANDTNLFRYCGEYFDKETGTIYLRARYYDPTIGRFITEDSYWGKDSDPLSLNLYTYCGNNPIDYIDPSGHLSAKVRTILWAIRHPVEAYQIGEAEPGKGKINYTNVAIRFSTNDLGLTENASHEGSQVNAYRHVLWQAMITKSVPGGEETAREVGYCHEENPNAIDGLSSRDLSKKVFKTLLEADESIDLANNIIGISIGKSISSYSNNDIAIATLKYYHENGFWVAVKQSDGSYKISQTKLSDRQYKAALNRIEKLDDWGFAED